MKNLRKLLAVIVVVAMMATMFAIPAFAAEPSDADICETLGMLKGTEGKVDSAYLATTPLRYQAAIMFLRLKGLEKDALAYKGTDNFDDAGEIWADGQKMLAYLKANPDLGFVGVGDNKFDPMGEMTAQAYYKVLLVALGYEYDADFGWDDVFAFAKEAGLSKVADVKAFTVNDLAVATVEAFKVNVKGEEFTLIEYLVAEGTVAEEAAIEVGLVEPEPEVLAVNSVSADNLKQIYVEFNGAELDKKAAEDKDNYKLVDTDDKEIDLDSADLDGNVVTLTLKAGVKNQTKAKLTVKSKILGGDEKFDFEFVDTTLPKAVSAEVAGISTIKMIFSEPIDKVDKDCFEVDGGDYYIKDVKKVNNDTEVNIVLYSTLDEGDLEVKIKTNGIEDYAGFSVLKKTFKLTVKKDKEAPVVVGYKDAKPGSVTLIFNEDIELVDGDQDNYYHTNANNAVDADITENDIDGKELKLSFSNNWLPEGTAYVYVLKNSLKDLWENKNDKVIVEVKVVVDDTPPAIKKLEVKTESQIIVTFDEAVEKKSAEDEKNYTILDDKGAEVKDIFAGIVQTSSDKVTIDFTKNLSGKYVLAIDGVEDEYDNAAKLSYDFEVDDLTEPDFADFKATLYYPGAKGQLVKIDFDEKMATDGKYSVTDIDKYEIDGNDLADLEVEPTFKVVNDGKSIEIKIASTVDDSKKGVDLAATSVVIARVADAAGNYTKALYGTVTLDAAGNVAIDKAQAIAKDEVKVTFKDYFSKFDAKDIILTTDGGTTELALAKATTSVDSKGNSVITFKLKNKLGADAKDGGKAVSVEVVAVVKSENKYGETLLMGATKAVEDKIAPVLFSDKASEYLDNASDNVFELRFSEDIVVADGVYAFAAADFEVKAGSDVLVYGKDYTVSAGKGSDWLKFSLVKGGVFKADTDKTFTVYVKSAATAQYVKDVAGNAIKDVNVNFRLTVDGSSL